MKRILFIDLGVNNQSAPRGNLGMMAVAEYVRRYGHHINIIQNVFSGLSEKKIITMASDYDVVAMSSVLPNARATCNFAKKIKDVLPTIKLVVGGAGPTVLPSFFFHSNLFNVTITGPGEDAIVKWLNGEIRDGIIEGKNSTNWIAVPYGKADKEIIESSQLQGLSYIKPAKQRVINFQTSRGCPFNCTFCASPVMWGRRVQYGNVKKIAEKISWAVEELGVNCGDCVDLNFNLNSLHAIAFCDELMKQGVNERFAWTAMLNPGIETDTKLLKALRNAGCFKIGAGIEALTSEGRGLLRKHGKDVARCFSLLERARKIGLLVRAFLIIATPGQTDEDLSFIKKGLANLPADEISISFAVPNFGTEMYRNNVDHIKQLRLDKWNMHHPIFLGRKTEKAWHKIRADLYEVFQNHNTQRSAL